MKEKKKEAVGQTAEGGGQRWMPSSRSGKQKGSRTMGDDDVYLHANDGVYKEQHHYQQGYIGQCLREKRKGGREREGERDFEISKR